MATLKNSDFKDILGSSQRIGQAILLGKRAACSDIPVLITGESGVGKELLAGAIHHNSERREKPFVAVNCGAIPENLAESILFGHEKGAFTGAVVKTIGKFREADGGTLFLDEIGDCSPHIQVKILRALQEGEIEPVGAAKSVSVSVRIIAATHKNLAQQVEQNLFRDDLYYRIQVFPIHIPPLRERTEDIVQLAKQFIKKLATQEKKIITGWHDEVGEMLTTYPWPGNVRELYNTLFRAVVLCDGEQISLKDFPEIRVTAASSDSNLLPFPCPTLALTNAQGHIRNMQELEEDIMRMALHYYHGHVSEAARRLGISRSTLYRKLESLHSSSHNNASFSAITALFPSSE